MVAVAFAFGSVGVFAASHAGAAPAKTDCKDAKNKDHKDCMKKDDMKKK